MLWRQLRLSENLYFMGIVISDLRLTASDGRTIEFNRLHMLVSEYLPKEELMVADRNFSSSESSNYDIFGDYYS